MSKSGNSTAAQVYDEGIPRHQMDVSAFRLLRQCVGPNPI